MISKSMGFATNWLIERALQRVVLAGFLLLGFRGAIRRLAPSDSQKKENVP
jgi:hypothetical protein